jgi:hypothetical protein
MPRTALAAGLLAALAGPAAAQPTAIPPAAGAAKIDGALKVEPYKLVRLKADLPAGASCVWRVRPARGVDWATPNEGREVAFVAPPGSYCVELFTVTTADGKAALGWDEVTVEIGPPVPPAPPPAPPAPPNPYRAPLRAAFDADPGDPGAKVAVRKDLADLYALAVTVAADPAVASTDVLRERLRRAGATLAADQLVGTRTAIAALLAPVLPLGQPLTDERRRAAADLFRLVAEALAW